MSDKLAVIQAESSVAELEKIKNKVTQVVKVFGTLVEATDRVNSGLSKGTPKETLSALKETNGITKQYLQIEKELIATKEKATKVQLAEQRIATENARTLKEQANAEKANLLLQERKNKVVKKGKDIYGQYSAKANETKRRMKNLRLQMIETEKSFKKGAISADKFEKKMSQLGSRFARVKNEAVGLDRILKSIDASAGDHQRNVGNYQSALKGLGKGFGGMMSSVGAMAGGFAVVEGASMLGQIIGDSYKTVAELNSINLAMKEVFTTQEEVGYQKVYLKDLASKYGIEIKGLTDSYVKFSAATKNTALEGQEAMKIFQAFSGAGAKLGLPTEQINGMYKALEQMVSKGNIQAEELRGQLGERLPGAVKLFAYAMGVSVEELNDMLKKGQVLAADVLPKVAEKLNEMYGVEGKVEGLNQAQNRLKNEWTEFLETLSTNEDFINAITTSLEFAQEALSLFLDLLITGGDDGISVFGELSEVMEMVGDIIETLTGGLFKNEKGWRLVDFVANNVKMNLTAISSIIQLVIKGIDYFYASIKDMMFGTENAIKKLSDFGDIITKTKEKLMSLSTENGAILANDDKMLEQIKRTKDFSKELERARKNKQKFFVYNNFWRDTENGGTFTNKRATEYIFLNGELVKRDDVKIKPAPKPTGNEKTKKEKKPKAPKTPKAPKQKTQEQLDKEAFDKAKFTLDNNLAEMEELIRQRRINAKNNLFGYELLQAEIELDNELIQEKEKYYERLNLLNAKYKQDATKTQLQQNKELFDLENERNQKLKELSPALLEKQQKEIEYLKILEQQTCEQQKQEILTNRNISAKDREHRLKILSYQQQIKENKKEQEKLRLLIEQLKAKQQMLQAQGKDLTDDEKTSLSDAVDKTIQLDTQNIETEKAIEKLNFDKFISAFAPLKDMVQENLSNLGLERVAEQFESLYQKLLEEGKDFTLSFEDVMASASAMIGDFASKAISANLEKEMAYLDDQLKRSQEATETELSFIDKRLNALNSLGTLTKEQEEERRALEDETIVIKEQQAQKEKMLQTQKARAEQRAQAQQALMNGALGATMTIAKMGLPWGLVGAAASIAFGALQAGLIMSKNPIPQYFVGTKNAPKGWAWTDERGAEIHTDKHGNIKDLGSNKGARLKYLEQGDRIYTATETRKFLENIKSPHLDDSALSQMIIRTIQVPTSINSPMIDYDKLAMKIGEQQERIFRKYDKTNVYEINGRIYKEQGGRIPEIIGRSKKQSYTIKIKGNDRN